MIAVAELRRHVNAVLPRVRALRHRLHRRPEIALAEHATSALVRATLKGRAVRLLAPFLETDVVAFVDGPRPGPNVTLRADMDALPLAEATGVAYASRTASMMHACGHDGHTAMLLGAALVLARLRPRLAGSVRFVFQPGEEVVGAGQQLVAAGALRDPRPAAVFALHAWHGIPVGTIAARPGVMMAAADFFTLRIQGRGGHGSAPELCVDSILTGARVVEALQTVVARRVRAADPVVLSVCRFTGGSNGNVLPDVVELEGTVRYLDRALGRRLPGMIEQIANGVCAAMGATCTLTYRGPYVPTVNTPTSVDLGRDVARRLFGARGWVELEHPSMGGEDFAYYLQDHPGAIFRLGMGEDCPPLHNPHFDFRDDALGHGILFLVAMALDVLAAGDPGR